MHKVLKTTLIPLTASAILLGGCSGATGHKEDTLIHSKAGDVKTADVMKKMGNDQVSKTSFQLILSKVLKDKYDNKVDKKDVDREVNQKAAQMGGKDRFNSMLKQQGMTEKDFKEQIKMQKYQDLLIQDNVKVSDKEIEKDSKKVSHILVEAGHTKKEKQEAKNKAEDLKQQIDNGANFKELATTKSDDSQSKNEAGSLGYIIKGQMEPKFEKTAFKLKPGEVSDPVKTSYGYHIIKAEKNQDIKGHKDQLRKQVIQHKVQKDPSILTKAYKKVLDEYKVEYKDKDVKKYINNELLDSQKMKEKAQSQQQTMRQ